MSKKPTEYYYIDGITQVRHDPESDADMDTITISSNLHSECVKVIGDAYKLTQRAVAIINALNAMEDPA